VVSQEWLYFAAAATLASSPPSYAQESEFDGGVAEVFVLKDAVLIDSEAGSPAGLTGMRAEGNVSAMYFGCFLFLA